MPDQRLEILQGEFADIKRKYFPRIPSYQIEIAELEKDTDGKELRGQCDLEKRLITIFSNTPVDEYRSIMLHEMAHHVGGMHGKPMQAKLRRAFYKAQYDGNQDDADMILDEIVNCQLAQKEFRQATAKWCAEGRREANKKDAEELATFDPSVPGPAPRVLQMALDDFSWADTGWE